MPSAASRTSASRTTVRDMVLARLEASLLRA
jgi:hypothetical protein